MKFKEYIIPEWDHIVKTYVEYVCTLCFCAKRLFSKELSVFFCI
jgi:hypothetical protein